MSETSHRCSERRSNRENLRREVRNQLILAAAGVLSLASLAITAPAPSRADKCKDVALVLAVDGSGSVSTEEFYFQQQAIAAALRDREVLEAFARAGTVAVAVLYWGDAEWPVQETGFVSIQDLEDAERLVTAVETMPRRVLGNTGLSMGLSAALDKLETVGCAHRMVINVSADGTDTISTPRRLRFPIAPGSPCTGSSCECDNQCSGDHHRGSKFEILLREPCDRRARCLRDGNKPHFRLRRDPAPQAHPGD
jgi:hypothetical protein